SRAVTSATKRIITRPTSTTLCSTTAASTRSASNPAAMQSITCWSQVSQQPLSNKSSRRLHGRRIEQVRKRGLPPLLDEFDERGQAPLPDLFYSGLAQAVYGTRHFQQTFTAIDLPQA